MTDAGEASLPADGTSLEIVVRQLSGNVVFGPLCVSATLQAEELKARVLCARAAAVGGSACTVSLLLGSRELADTERLGDVGGGASTSLDLTAIFAEVTPLSEQEREDWLCYVQPWVSPEVLSSFPEGARADEEIVLGAVRRGGRALRHAHPALRGHRPLVLEAVRQDGRALEHASVELRADPEIVVEAVLQNASSLQFASEELRENETILRVAAQSHSEAEGRARREDPHSSFFARAELRKRNSGTFTPWIFVATQMLFEALGSLCRPTAWRCSRRRTAQNADAGLPWQDIAWPDDDGDDLDALV